MCFINFRDRVDMLRHDKVKFYLAGLFDCLISKK